MDEQNFGNGIKEECADREHRESLMQINPERVAKYTSVAFLQLDE
jgi:hypothetical protein